MKNIFLILFLFGVLFSSTFTISADGSTTLADVESLKHETGIAFYNSLVQVDADTYALAYSDGTGDDGYITTFTISADWGRTTITVVEQVKHDDAMTNYNSLVHVAGDTYALAYSGVDDDGYISTFDIDSAGDITPIKVANHVALGEGSSANLEHDGANGKYNSLVQVDADTYALAYSGADEDADDTGDGYITTFTISADGRTTLAEVESIEHDGANGKYNSLVHVAGDTYALAYSGADEDADGTGDGYISTFDIDSAGDITPIKVANHVALGEGSSANLEHDGANGKYNSLVQVDADTYALAYAGDTGDGFITTFTISANGSTTLAEVESLKHDDSKGRYNSLVQVDADTYALAYSGSGDDGFISTFTIDSTGDITPIKVANHVALGEGSSVNLEHDNLRGKYNSLVQVDANHYVLAFTTNGQDGQISVFTIGSEPSDTTKKSSSDCYDCKPPTLQESHITILSNDYVVATGDSPLHITANVGDKVMVILNVTDNKSVQGIPFAALYTNYQEKPSGMSAFYANNYDKWKHVSTSFYEWNIRADDVAYDYDGTITWSDNAPTVVTGEITDENYFMINDDNVLEYFMMPFTFTINDSMETSQIIAKIYDASGNRLHVTLPVTLETAGNEPLNFDHMGKQKVLGFYDESVLSEMVGQWNESESDAKQLSSLLGISEEQLPPWTSNLATWVAEGTIDSADLIIAVEYLINQ